MPYYHVLIQTADAPKTRVFFKDLSAPELRTKFTVPYGKGTTLISGGEVVPVGTIRYVRVVRTEQTDEVTRDEINRKSRASIDEMNRESSGVVFISIGSGFDPEDILESGADVTSEVITEPPGSTKSQFDLSRLLHNPWLVAVVGGVVAALILLR